MTSQKGGFYFWRCLPSGEVIKVGSLAIEPLLNGKIDKIQFQYSKAYINREDAIPLAPLNAPLSDNLLIFESNGHHLPGFIDDCIADDWAQNAHLYL